MDELVLDFNRLLVKLEDPNKVERKNSLGKLKSLVEEKFPEASLSGDQEEILLQLWQNKLCRPLLRSVGTDPTERVREVAAEIVLHIVSILPAVSEVQGPDFLKLCYIFPLLLSRLDSFGNDSSNSKEPSEEVRLLLLKIQAKVLKKCVLEDESEVDHLKAHVDDLLNILKSTILDSFSDASELSCQSVELLSKALPKTLALNGPSSLIPSLTKVISHQQKKVRFAAINAIGSILLHGSYEDFGKVGSHLAQRLFDSIPQVRLAVSLCAGNLLLNWRFGESNAPLLVPLLLTSLEDTVPEIRETCKELWEQVGQSYIEKLIIHDVKLKEKMEFFEGSGKPNHYPKSVSRPSFGCRQFVTRIIVKLLPALKNDLQDWLVDTRIKASQLLFVLIVHLEETAVINQHAEPLLNLMHLGTKDSEKVVVLNMGRCAELYGFFVPPSTWCSMVVERLLANPNAGELMIFSKILDGTDPDLLRSVQEDLAITLQHDKICLSYCTNYLTHLLGSVDAILTIGGKDCKVVRRYLFKVGITVMSLSIDTHLKSEAKDFLEKLASSTLSDIIEDSNWLELFRHEMGPLLRELAVDCKQWSATSFGVQIFSTLLQESGPVVGYFVEQVIGMFRDVLSQESLDSELQLKMFIMLSKQLMETANRIDSKKQFGPYAIKVLNALILPALSWHAGKKASAVRTAATSSLWSLSESELLKAKDICYDQDMANRIFPAMNRLLEDDSVKTRVFVCKTYKRFFESFKRDFPPHYLITISSVLLKRLDDVHDEVRLEVLHSLSPLAASLPPSVGKTSPELESHFRSVYTTLLIHMDDQNHEIRAAAMETLLSLSDRCPNILVELTKESAKNHTHEECSVLLAKLNSLVI